MIAIFRISLFISLAFLIFLGWILIFLGFGIIPTSVISPFIDYKIAIFGFFMWFLALVLFSFEKKLFCRDDGIDIDGKYGSIRITKSAIRDLIRQIEIDGVDELLGKVSIRNRKVDLKIRATCFLPSISGIAENINKEIDEIMKELLITDYRKMVYINHIKKRRKLV